MCESLRSTVSSIGSSIFTARLYGASAVASVYTTARQCVLNYTGTLHPYWWLTIPTFLVLIIFYSILAFYIISGRRTRRRDARLSGQYLEHNIVSTDVPPTNTGLRGMEQSPSLSNEVVENVLRGLKPMSSMIVHQTNVIFEPPVRISPLRGATFRQRSSCANHSQVSISSSPWPNYESKSADDVYIQRSSRPGEHSNNAAVSSSNDSDEENKPPPIRSPLFRIDDSSEIDEAINHPMVRQLPQRSDRDGSEESEPRNYNHQETRDLLGSNARHQLSPLRQRASTPPELKSGSWHDSTTTVGSITAGQMWLAAGSPPSSYSESESHYGVSPNSLSAILQPYTRPPPRLILRVNPPRRGAPREGRRAPERFADSEYSIREKN